MSANMFAALSVEAYLNHLGPIRFKCWASLERLAMESKLTLLLEDMGKSADFARRPFQTLKVMVSFRNALAHGKTETVEAETIQKLLPGQRPEYPYGDWERLCNQKDAGRFLDDSKAMIEQLHSWAGLDTRLLFSLGGGMHVIHPPESHPNSRAEE